MVVPGFAVLVKEYWNMRHSCPGWNSNPMLILFIYLVLFWGAIDINAAVVGGDCSDPPYFFGYNNPLFPSSPPAADSVGNIATDRLIPRHIWIAIRNKSDDRPSHILEFAKKNSNWLIHYADNEDKDRFMETVFANTSLLWAYNIVNPVIGVSKSEIWRLAVLYVYGGLYMDDDANLGTRLDEIVRPTDQFIISQEYYLMDERCFIEDYRLSNKSFVKRYGAEAMSQVIFGNKFIANWAMFSAPRHPVLMRTIEYAVELIRFDFLDQSKISVSWNGERTDGRKLMCCTTHPLIYACRALVLEKLEELSRSGGIITGGGRNGTLGTPSSGGTTTTIITSSGATSVTGPGGDNKRDHKDVNTNSAAAGIIPSTAILEDSSSTRIGEKTRTSTSTTTSTGTTTSDKHKKSRQHKDHTAGGTRGVVHRGGDAGAAAVLAMKDLASSSAASSSAASSSSSALPTTVTVTDDKNTLRTRKRRRLRELLQTATTTAATTATTVAVDSTPPSGQQSRPLTTATTASTTSSSSINNNHGGTIPRNARNHTAVNAARKHRRDRNSTHAHHIGGGRNSTHTHLRNSTHTHHIGISPPSTLVTTTSTSSTTSAATPVTSINGSVITAVTPTTGGTTSSSDPSTKTVVASPPTRTTTTTSTSSDKDKEMLIEKKIAVEQAGMMSSRELEAAAAALGIRVVRPFFSDYGGQMKAWYNDWKPNHWVKLVRRHNPYMRAHISNAPSYLEGKPVKLHGGRSIYYVENCTKREFPSFDAFQAMKFDLDNVITVLSETLDKIPLGLPMPQKPSPAVSAGSTTSSISKRVAHALLAP